MKVGGICGECRKYYRGADCNNPACATVSSGETVNVINDIPEHFNRGLGQVVRGRVQYNALLREKGLTEVGNEKKYVSPEYNEKLQQQKEEKIYSGARERAMRMLENSPTWN